MNFIRSAPLFLNRIYNDKRLLLAAIFFISLVASSLFLTFMVNVGPWQHEAPGTDYRSFYEPVAYKILQGKGFTPDGETEPRYPPGYPIILAGIFSLAHLLRVNELGLIIVFNVMVTAGTACFLFLIAELIFNRKIALIASVLWLSYPLWLWFLKNPNTEVPFILLLYAAFWLYLQALMKKRFGLVFLSGIIFGLASLIRPISFLLPFILALLVFFLLKEGSKKLCLWLALVLVAGNLLAILPWEVYVFSNIGRVVPLSVNGPGSIADGLTFAVKPGDGGNQAVFSNDVMVLMKRAESENLTSTSEILHFLGRELVNQPIALMKLIGWKMARAWYATSQMWWETKILLLQLIYLVPGLLGIIYFVRKRKDKIREMVFLLVIVFYFWLMTTVALSVLRYMVPAMGMVMIFSAITISVLIDKIRFSLKSNPGYGQ